MSIGTIPGISETPSEAELKAAGYRRIATKTPEADPPAAAADANFQTICLRYANDPAVLAVVCGDPEVLWVRPKDLEEEAQPAPSIPRILSQDEQTALSAHNVLLAALEMSQRGEVSGAIVVVFRKDGAFREMSSGLLNVNEKLGALYRIMNTLASAGSPLSK